MISISSLLPREAKFYDLMEASAEEVRGSADQLNALLAGLGQSGQATPLSGFTEHRRKDKQITQEISEALCKTFVTPIDREDILALSSALYRIPKLIERTGERLAIYRLKPWQNDFQRQNDLLLKATDALVFMVRNLRNIKDPDKVRARNQELQRLEGEGDKLVLQLTHKLFMEVSDMKEVLMRRDIYEMLEKTLDRFRDAGNVIVHIALKHT